MNEIRTQDLSDTGATTQLEITQKNLLSDFWGLPYVSIVSIVRGLFMDEFMNSSYLQTRT